MKAYLSLSSSANFLSASSSAFPGGGEALREGLGSAEDAGDTRVSLLLLLSFKASALRFSPTSACLDDLPGEGVRFPVLFLGLADLLATLRLGVGDRWRRYGDRRLGETALRFSLDLDAERDLDLYRGLLESDSLREYS